MQSINVHVSDLLGLGELIEHAEFHEKELNDNWFSFYIKHFGAESENHIKNDHQEKHQKLPSHDHFSVTTAHFFIITTNSEVAISNDFQLQENTDYSYLEMIPNFVGEDIFQPPISA